MHRCAVVAAALVAVACSTPAAKGPPAADASAFTSVDASDVPDAAVVDAGEPDAGPIDAGVVDAGPVDAGELDAGVDAGSPAGPLTLGIPCTDSLDSVYVSPTNLPPMAPENRGDIVRCAVDVKLSQSEVAGQLAQKGVMGVTPTSGTNTFRIAYRTTRADGVDGIGTARVFLPTAPREGALPALVSAHGSDGIADICAPSKDPTGNAELTMPFAGTGYAVIAPDYAGLGNEGVQGYVDNRDTGHSTLDAARALRKLLPAGTLSSKVALVGYSQGGGAVLSAQALAKEYGADGDLAAVIVFAAEWQSRLDSFGFIKALRSPNSLTISLGISKPVVYILRQYAYQVNQKGPAAAGSGFPAMKAMGLVNGIETQCLAALGATVQAQAPYVHDLMDDTLRQGLLSCVDGTGCSGDAKDLFDYLNANILTADRSGPPLLYIVGLLDTIMPPAEEAACNIQKLAMDGVAPQICVDSGGQHTDVTHRNAALALSWLDATLTHRTPPACSSSGLPACTP